MKPWSAEEHAILEQYYPTEGALVAKRLPGRSVGTIGVRAATHGISMTPEARRAAMARGGSVRRNNAHVRRVAQVTRPPETPVLPSLPTVLYPVDPDTARSVASACQYLAHFSDAMKAIGPEATRFFDPLCQRLRAHADRQEAEAAKNQFQAIV